jgi:energy-coupling factor transporter ATP-binding protein EcfA2
MKLINSFNIREFRGIKGLEKPIELSKFNVLVGRNCTGKTSILQALYLLAMPLRESTIPPYDRSASVYIGELIGDWKRLVYGYSGEATISFELGVKGVLKYPLDIPPRILSLSLESKTVGYETVNVERVEVKISAEKMSVEAKTRAFLGGNEVEISLLKDLYEDFVKSLNPRGSALALYVPNHSNAYKELHDYSFRSSDGIVKKGLHTKVCREYLEDVIYDKFTEVFTRGNELFVRKEVGDTAIYVSLNDLGEGVKRFILMYFAVEHLNPALVLWDDIEVAMHPSLMNTLLKWLAESERQVVIATHSLDVLHSLIFIEPRDAKIIILKKDANDMIHHKGIELDELEEILEKGIDPRAIIEGVVE